MSINNSNPNSNTDNSSISNPIQESTMSNSIPEQIRDTFKAKVAAAADIMTEMSTKKGRTKLYFPCRYMSLELARAFMSSEVSSPKDFILDESTGRTLQLTTHEFSHVCKIGFNRVGFKMGADGVKMPTVSPVVEEIMTADQYHADDTLTLSDISKAPNVEFDLVTNPLFGGETIAKWSAKEAKQEATWTDVISGMMNSTPIAPSSMFSFSKDKFRHTINKTKDDLLDYVDFYTKDPEGGEEKAIKRISGIVDCDEPFCINFNEVRVVDDNVDGLLECNPEDVQMAVRKATEAGRLKKKIKIKPNTRINTRIFDGEMMYKGDIRVSTKVPRGVIIVYGMVNACPEVRLKQNTRRIAFFRLGESNPKGSISQPCFVMAKGFMEIFAQSFKHEVDSIKTLIESGKFLHILANAKQEGISEMAQALLDNEETNSVKATESVLKIWYLNQKKVELGSWALQKKCKVRGSLKVSPGPITEYSDLEGWDQSLIESYATDVAHGEDENVYTGIMLGKEYYMGRRALGKCSFSHGTMDFDDKLEKFAKAIIKEETHVHPVTGETHKFVTYDARSFRWPVGWREVRAYQMTIIDPEQYGIILYPDIELIAPPLERDDYNDLFPSTEKADKKKEVYPHALSVEKISKFVADEGIIGVFYNGLLCEINSGVDIGLKNYNTSDVVDASVAGEGKSAIDEVMEIIKTNKETEFVLDGFFEGRGFSFFDNVSFDKDGPMQTAWVEVENYWEEQQAMFHNHITENIKQLREALNLKNFIVNKWNPKVHDLARMWGAMYSSAMEKVELLMEQAGDLDEEDPHAETLEDEATLIGRNARRVVMDRMLSAVKSGEHMGEEYQYSVGLGLLLRFCQKYGTEALDLDGNVIKDDEGNVKINNAMLTFIMHPEVLKLIGGAVKHLQNGGSFPTIKAWKFDTQHAAQLATVGLHVEKSIEEGKMVDSIIYKMNQQLETGEVSEGIGMSVYVKTGIPFTPDTNPVENPVVVPTATIN
jgi:hypothetical protein